MRARRAQKRVERPFAVPASAALTALMLLALGCSRSPEPPKPARAPAEDRPSLAAVGGPSGRFTGSDSCRECHIREFEAWSGSRHRSTLRPWAKGDPLLLASVPVPEPYRVGPDGSVEGPGTDGKPATGTIAFVVGGRHREDALVRLADGRLQVFPVAFDVDLRRAFDPLRELAGGTAPPTDVVDFWTRVGRNADLACYGCHATGQTLENEGVSPAGLILPGSRWLEPGVGCEACHGPGGPHIAAARTGKPGKDTVRMPTGGAAVVDACAACHGLRDVLASPFSDVPAHRYGEPIYAASDPLLGVASNFEFRDPFFPDLRPATYQQEAIAFSQAGCARKGGMTCAACHDVHSGAPVAALSAADGGDAVCAPCHENIAGRGLHHTLHRPGTRGGRCLDCHMAPILRGPGAQPARDHSLSPPMADAGEIPAACTACHVGEKTAASVAAAWRRVAEGPVARRRRAIATALLSSSSESATLKALARIASDTDRGWFVEWAAIQRIAATATGPSSDAVTGVLRAALADPNPAVRRAAARALGRAGHPSDVEALQTASADVDPWAALEAAHGMALLGSPTAGTRLLQLLKRPDLIADARAQYAFGHACLVGRDYARAETGFRRALEINPMMVGAISDLGLAQLGQDKRAEALASWRRALEINPRYKAARQNLDATLAAPSAKP